jgi:ribosome recycling factor
LLREIADVHSRSKEDFRTQDAEKSLEALKADLAKVRTGRAHTGLLDHVQVEYYGSLVPINTVANVTLIDARTLGVQAWEKGWRQRSRRPFVTVTWASIQSSQGDLIRVPMPADRGAAPRSDQGGEG